MNEVNEFNQPVGKLVTGWKQALKPALQILSGEFCKLEPMDIDKHANTLFENLLIDNKGESWTYLPYGPFDNLTDFITWLKETMSEKDTLLYAVIDIKTNLPVGIAGYLRSNPKSGSIEVGHLHFSKLLKKSVVATEAMYLMMSNAFDNLNYRRYEWKCNDLNHASRSAALRLGFKFEGIFRQSDVLKNRNRDTAWFSIIDSEWPQLKDKFKKWLHHTNFDNQGQQKKRLQDM